MSSKNKSRSNTRKQPQVQRSTRSSASSANTWSSSAPDGFFRLVIVESPAKAKTISTYLGSGFYVMASLGHVSDLPPHELGIDIQNGFTPRFVILEDRRQLIERLRVIAQKATQVLLATDPDREGEAIAWHLQRLIRSSCNGVPIVRITFNAITEESIKRAIREPRQIDGRLVEAQIARRVVDRLVGYLISEHLWSAFGQRTLSAGRVQSVALRMVVERDRAIASFTPRPYWVFDAIFRRLRDGKQFRARLIAIAGRPPEIEDQQAAERLILFLRSLCYKVAKRTEKKATRNPPPPFVTSTLQQSAARLLKLSPEQTMRFAQQLYEGVEVEGKRVGLITYMRTDSPRVAPEAQAEARAWIESHLGSDYLPQKPPAHHARGHAQDAHEAIRPTSVWREPERLERQANWRPPMPALYALIWRRFLASQSVPAVFDTVTVEIAGEEQGRVQAQFMVRGRQLRFPGFLALYPEHKDDVVSKEREEHDSEQDRHQPPYQDDLPDLLPGEPLALVDITADMRWTKPPPHFTEAALVSAMERQGIGRPSTYAAILQRLKEKKYVSLEKGTLRATQLGMQVCDYLVEHFPTFVDIKYTAQLEESLDAIESGRTMRNNVVEAVYKLLVQTIEHISHTDNRVSSQASNQVSNQACETEDKASGAHRLQPTRRQSRMTSRRGESQVNSRQAKKLDKT